MLRRVKITGLLLLLFTACETDLDEDNTSNPGNPNQPNATFDPEKASEYLVLKDASKINGSLPSATDGNLKIDIQDTIFSVKGHPLGARIRFKHGLGQDVTGFYVKIPGASFYYDIPEKVDEEGYIAEDGDTTAILELDLDPPADDNFPYTVEVTIQPHGQDGNPFDEFHKWITVEDPAQNTCAISQTHPCPGSAAAECGALPQWVWEYSIREYNGQILTFQAPGINSRINSFGWGCCTKTGRSVTAGQSPSCSPNTQVMTWVEMEVYDFVRREFDWLYIWENGTVDHVTSITHKQYWPSLSNFCDRIAGYEVTEDGAVNSGTHSYTPGDSYIDFEFPSWQGSYKPQDANLIYTCHTLIMYYGVEERWTKVYRRYDGSFDPFEIIKWD